MTSDINRRMNEHQNGQVASTKGGRYKKVWHCAFADKAKAREFEKYLKSSSGYAFANKHLI